MSNQHIHFVTGRLAEHSLRTVLEDVAPRAGFAWSIGVMPITVAALMTPDWIARRIAVPSEATKVLLPGYCHGDLAAVEERAGVAVGIGPKDLRQLPEYFLGEALGPEDGFGEYDIEILAEINHAPRMDRNEILRQAKRLAADGADIIDIGCEPGDAWPGVSDCVKALCDEGLRVSVDSWNPVEVAAATAAGAELVLSVNSKNCAAAADWGCEVVVIPDEFATLRGLDEAVARLRADRVPFRIDPVLEPIGCGFAGSLLRCAEVRTRYPDERTMIGIGNVTELTDVDSAGINVLLLGICQELGIGSVLTTEVINWSRTSVRECDLARRLVHYAIGHGMPPKRVDDSLVILRDARLHRHGAEQLDRLAAAIKDSNYRIFAEDGQIHLLGAGLHLQDADPFRLFDRLMATQPKNLDPSHAFYLGHELSKAATALTLHKEYTQDESLDWGYLTQAESGHRLDRTRRSNPQE